VPIFSVISVSLPSKSSLVAMSDTSSTQSSISFTASLTIGRSSSDMCLRRLVAALVYCWSFFFCRLAASSRSLLSLASRFPSIPRIQPPSLHGISAAVLPSG